MRTLQAKSRPSLVLPSRSNLRLLSVPTWPLFVRRPPLGYTKASCVRPLLPVVNVTRPGNVIKGLLACGATTLTVTSSGPSVSGVPDSSSLRGSLKQSFFTRVSRDDVKESTRPHDTFFPDHRYTKLTREARAFAADMPSGENRKLHGWG